MQIAKQFSVGAVNKPGRLGLVLEALRKEKVELVGLAIMDTSGRHALRFVPNDPQLASSALETVNVDFSTHDVLLVELPNQPGAYPHLCERLAAGHLEMDYSYVATRGSHRGGTAIVKVNDLAKAQRVLSEPNQNGHTKKLPRRRPLGAR